METKLNRYVESKIHEYIQRKRKRDTKKVRDLKKEYNHACQICGEPVIMFGCKEKGIFYSEVCHIVPYSKNGLDDFPNMIVLCPNHHIIFDMGIISIDPNDPELKTVKHIDTNNSLNNSKLKISKHHLSREFVKYHYENVHNSLIKELFL